VRGALKIGRNGKRGNRRGMFYSIDALFALGLLLVASFIFTTPNENLIAKSNYQQLHFIADDSMQVLGKLRLKDLDSFVISNITSNTNITLEDVNKTLDEIMAMLWAYNETQYIDYLVDVIFRNSSFLPNGTSISIIFESPDNWTEIYSSGDTNNKEYMASSYKIVSGYKENTNPLGFVARAWASVIRKNTTSVVSFDPQGSGWGGNETKPGIVNITKYFDLGNITHLWNATLYLSLHSSNGTYTLVDINNGNCTFRRNEFSQNETFFESRNVKSCLHNGTNTITLSLRNPSFHGHIHPGTRLEIYYEESQKITKPTVTYTDEVFFDNLYSIGGNESKTGA